TTATSRSSPTTTAGGRGWSASSAAQFPNKFSPQREQGRPSTFGWRPPLLALRAGAFPTTAPAAPSKSAPAANGAYLRVHRGTDLLPAEIGRPSVSRRMLHQAASLTAAGISSAGCSVGHNPTPSSGTTGISPVYDQVLKAIALHSSATPNPAPRSAAVAYKL